MPELPEVETVCRHLAGHLVGQRVSAVTLQRADLRYPIPVEAIVALREGRVQAVRRRAKYLLIEVALAAGGQRQVLVHLGMSGRLFVQAAHDDEPLRKHEHWRWTLDGPGGRQLLRYVDARRFGALDVLDDAGRHALVDGLGPEPLDAAWTGRDLYAQCRGRRVPIKQVLMDAQVVVGIGNIYASETCFRAAIHPLRPAGKLKRREADALVAAARAVLGDAIAAGGSSLRDFVGGNEAPGYFQQRLDVYDREGEPCHRCQGRIVRAVTAQRATYWCSDCQR